jgi:hypothetical protein
MDVLELQLHFSLLVIVITLIVIIKERGFAPPSTIYYQRKPMLTKLTQLNVEVAIDDRLDCPDPVWEQKGKEVCHELKVAWGDRLYVEIVPGATLSSRKRSVEELKAIAQSYLI